MCTTRKQKSFQATLFFIDINKNIVFYLKKPIYSLLHTVYVCFKMCTNNTVPGCVVADSLKSNYKVVKNSFNWPSFIDIHLKNALSLSYHFFGPNILLVKKACGCCQLLLLLCNSSAPSLSFLIFDRDVFFIIFIARAHMSSLFSFLVSINQNYF